MKKFLLKVFLPIVIVCGILFWAGELYLRSLPNDYKTQNAYMESHADSLKLLVLGSSATSRGVLPRYLDIQPSYNCAYSARSIEYDYYILEKYITKMDSLKYVVIDMNYSRLWWKIASSNRSATYIKYYQIYWGIPLYKGFDYQYEMSTSFTDINGLRSKYQKSNLEFDGYQAGGQAEYDEQQWISRAKERINYFNIEDKAIEKQYFEDNIMYLRRMIELCKPRNVQVLMIWFPVDKTMTDLFDYKQVQTINEVMYKLEGDYQNFKYYNLVNDTSFTSNDLMNVDHLNRQGASKATERINTILHDDFGVQ